MGEPGEVTVIGVGSVLVDDERAKAAFLLINRTEQSIANTSFYLSLQTNTKIQVLEKAFVKLDEDIYGSLPSNHVMPFLVDTDVLKVDVVYNHEYDITLDGLEFNQG